MNGIQPIREMFRYFYKFLMFEVVTSKCLDLEVTGHEEVT